MKVYLVMEQTWDGSGSSWESIRDIFLDPEDARIEKERCDDLYSYEYMYSGQSYRVDIKEAK